MGQWTARVLVAIALCLGVAATARAETTFEWKMQSLKNLLFSYNSNHLNSKNS